MGMCSFGPLVKQLELSYHNDRTPYDLADNPIVASSFNEVTIVKKRCYLVYTPITVRSFMKFFNRKSVREGLCTSRISSNPRAQPLLVAITRFKTRR